MARRSLPLGRAGSSFSQGSPGQGWGPGPAGRAARRCDRPATRPGRRGVRAWPGSVASRVRPGRPGDPAGVDPSPGQPGSFRVTLSGPRSLHARRPSSAPPHLWEGRARGPRWAGRGHQRGRSGGSGSPGPWATGAPALHTATPEAESWVGHAWPREETRGAFGPAVPPAPGWPAQPWPGLCLPARGGDGVAAGRARGEHPGSRFPRREALS